MSGSHPGWQVHGVAGREGGVTLVAADVAGGIRVRRLLDQLRTPDRGRARLRSRNPVAGRPSPLA